MARLVFIPAIASSMIDSKPHEIKLKHVEIEFVQEQFDLASFTKARILNYVRHKPTLKLFEQLGISLPEPLEEYTIAPNDKIIIVGLKTRQPKGVADAEVTIHDLSLAFGEVIY